MEEVLQFVDMISDKLATNASSDLVVGDPIQLGDVTVVPLCRLAIGMGGGGGQGEGFHHHGKKAHGGKGKGRSMGTGGHAKVRPVAVAVFSADGVEVIPIPDKKTPIEKLMEKVPEMVERFQEAHGCKGQG